MFRRGTSSSGKIHYRINIDKIMCPNPVDIYIETQVLDESYVSWDGDYVLNDNCIVTDLCSGCESYAYGKSSHGNYRVTVRIV